MAQWTLLEAWNRSSSCISAADLHRLPFFGRNSVATSSSSRCVVRGPSISISIVNNNTFIMFPMSSQKMHWIFSDEDDLTELREKTNAQFIEKHGTGVPVSSRHQSTVVCMHLYYPTILFMTLLLYHSPPKCIIYYLNSAKKYGHRDCHRVRSSVRPFWNHICNLSTRV